MPNPPDTCCSRCGTAYASTDGYPRACVNAECGAQTWANPVPVAVVLVPVTTESGTGLLVIRRGIPPQVGKLAIVGGFVDAEETWQSAGAREVMEETQVAIDAGSLKPFWYTSTEPRPNRVLLFSTAAPLEASALPPFNATNETTERGLVFGPDGLEDIIAFSLHLEAARRWFAENDITGPHAYAAI